MSKLQYQNLVQSKGENGGDVKTTTTYKIDTYRHKVFYCGYQNFISFYDFSQANIYFKIFFSARIFTFAGYFPFDFPPFFVPTFCL